MTTVYRIIDQLLELSDVDSAAIGNNKLLRWDTVSGKFVFAEGVDGVGLEYNWNGTELGVKREDEIDYAYVDLKGETGADGADGIDGAAGAAGADGVDGIDGVDGVSLQYIWDDTALGIKREDEFDYSYVDLKGETGATGADGVDGIDAFTLDQIAAVYVSKAGSNAYTGLNINVPKLTIGEAITAASALITGGADSVKIYVLDGEVYTENIEIPAHVSLEAHSTTLEGTVTLASNSTCYLNKHYASANDQNLLSKTGGSGQGHYFVNWLDMRGIAGTLTGGIGVRNVSNGSVIFARIGVLFVNAGGFGIADSAQGFGHIHFWAADIYLAGNNAVAIRGQSQFTDFIGYVDHILKFGSPTGTTGLLLSHADAIIKTTMSEIVADTAYNISAGSLHIVCPKITGTRTGTPVVEISSATYNNGNWDDAYDWGDHGSEGYITGNETVTLSGDITGSGATAIVTAIANNAVTDEHIRQGASASVIGRASRGSAGNVADIVSSADTVLVKPSTGDLMFAKIENVFISDGAIQAGKIQAATSTITGITFDRIRFISGENILLGRAAAGAGVIEEITLGANLTLDSNVLNASADSAWVTTGSDIYYDTGNVGIGTTTPSEKLVVEVVNTGTNARFEVRNGGFNSGLELASTATMRLRSDSGTVRIYQNGSDALTINGGNVGIGTTSPASLLHVDGGTFQLNRGGRLYLGCANAAGSLSNAALTNDAILRSDLGHLILTARSASGEIKFATGSPDTVPKMILTNAGTLHLDANQVSKIVLYRPHATFGSRIDFTNDGGTIGGISYSSTAIQLRSGGVAFADTKFTILANGNVGVGLGFETPQSLFHVAGNVTQHAIIQRTSDTADTEAVLGFRIASAVNSDWAPCKVVAKRVDHTNRANLSLRNYDGTASNDGVLLKWTGDIAIGHLAAADKYICIGTHDRDDLTNEDDEYSIHIGMRPYIDSAGLKNVTKYTKVHAGIKYKLCGWVTFIDTNYWGGINFSPPFPTGEQICVICTPNWDTTFWMSDITASGAVINVSVPPAYGFDGKVYWTAFAVEVL